MNPAHLCQFLPITSRSMPFSKHQNFNSSLVATKNYLSTLFRIKKAREFLSVMKNRKNFSLTTVSVSQHKFIKVFKDQKTRTISFSSFFFYKASYIWPYAMQFGYKGIQLISILRKPGG